MELAYAKFAKVVVRVAFWSLVVAIPLGSLLGFCAFFRLNGLEEKVDALHNGLSRVFQFLSAGQQ